MLDGFLTAIQSNSSLAPCLFYDLTEIVEGLMKRCVKPEVVEKADTSSQLMKIDLDDSKNMASQYEVVLGVSAHALLAKAKATDLQIMFFSDQLPKVPCCNSQQTS